VQLTGQPNGQYLFATWGGNASGTTNPINITMDSDKTVTASFFADRWQEAIDVSSVPFGISGNSTGATVEIDEPNTLTCDGININGGRATVWYKYTAPATQLVALDTLGSTTSTVIPGSNPPTNFPYDTYIAVYTGTITDSSVPVFCNDDNDTGYVSQLGFNTSAGVTYYIQVAEYNGLAGDTDNPGYNGGNLQFHVGFGSQTDIYVGGGLPQGNYTVLPQSSSVASFNLSNGPGKVVSANNVSMIAGERVIFSVNGVGTSYSEMMGLPQTQVATSYLFPWYNNLQLNSQLRFGNVGAASTIVSIKIHGVTQPTTYTLLPGESNTATFPVSDGPIEVFSNGQNIIAAERVIFTVNNTPTSYSELMGLPQTKLATSYLFPWYNNLQLNSQLRFGNVGAASTIVSIKIHGVTQLTTYTLLPGESNTATFPVSDGPIEVFSNGQNIIAAERVIFSVNGLGTSYSELMGLPQTQLATSYLFPWYNNLQLNSQLRFGNVGSASTIVSIKIHGVTQPTTYTLLPGESTTATISQSNGPIEVFSNGQNLIAAERVIFSVNGVGTSYSELMGLPRPQIATSYLFPWYNNLQLNSQFRFAVP
jgi:uncharacterized protein YcfL